MLVINNVTNVVFGSSKSLDDFEKIKSKVPNVDFEQAKDSFKIVEEVLQKNSESVSVFNTEILLVALLIPTIMVARGLCGYLNAYYMLPSDAEMYLNSSSVKVSENKIAIEMSWWSWVNLRDEKEW